jgi:hypothetical protein
VHSSQSAKEGESLGLAKTLVDRVEKYSPIAVEGSYGSQQHSSLRHRKNRCIESRGHTFKLVLGSDLTMPQVVDMANIAVVGRDHGRRFFIKTMKEWVETNWSKSLGYSPPVQLLAREWFLFKFGKTEEVD